ncbi:FAD-linked oxidoreductase azaL [Fusarium oxysporum f. sp. albedinis]|nr:FAD-linked oxidoreductase azaL [Fusarium oxysporum f. sp. albedinis]KAK2469489.1 hypothetical protein H9L39_18760 [Fusarium oxysporum f. sp. albedinis]
MPAFTNGRPDCWVPVTCRKSVVRLISMGVPRSMLPGDSGTMVEIAPIPPRAEGHLQRYPVYLYSNSHALDTSFARVSL